MSATNSFDDLLIRCETVNRQVFEMLDVSFDLDDRGVFALAYFRLIVDVQGSIVQLMRAERFPSAMALVRVTYEPMIRAHWIAQCAPACKVAKILESDDHHKIFESICKMAKDIDNVDEKTAAESVDSTPATFVDIFSRLYRNVWEPLNSYTHGGLRQISCMFEDERPSELELADERTKGLNLSTISLLLAGLLVARMARMDDVRERIVHLLRDWTSEVDSVGELAL